MSLLSDWCLELLRQIKCINIYVLCDFTSTKGVVFLVGLFICLFAKNSQIIMKKCSQFFCYKNELFKYVGDLYLGIVHIL